MKKFLIIFILFLGSNSLFSQQELKLDLFDALAFKSVEVSYEFYINEESSVGISALFNFEKRSADLRYNEDNMFTPYFRYHFPSTENWGFFGELFLGINSGEKEREIEKNTVLEKYTDGALGVAVGTKYLASKNIVIEAYAGAGRNLFDSDSYPVVPRVGLNIGYRF